MVMRYEVVDIKVANSVQAKLTLYIQDNYPQVYGDRKRPMVVICPGGGYEHVSPREGEAIAMQFMTAGCHAAVLWYDICRQDVVFPQELLELATAVSYIREHAQEYTVEADKILIAGFSAGGHLAAMLGCFWHEEWLEKLMKEEKGVSKESYQPNGMILAYPVITAGEFAHRGSFVNLMGEKAQKGDEATGLSGKELEEKLSLENQVTDKCPPVFMWHTFEDGAVPLENSLLFASALRAAGVNLEYHVFPRGGHGYGLGTKETAMVPAMKEIDPQIPQWIDLCKNWIKYSYLEK